MGYQINKLTTQATTMVRTAEGKIRGLDRSKNPVGDIKEILAHYHSALEGLIVEMVEIERILERMPDEQKRNLEIEGIKGEIKKIYSILRGR